MLKNTMKLAVAATLALTGVWAQAHEYKFTVLPFPGGASVMANAINSHGQSFGPNRVDSKTLNQRIDVLFDRIRGLDEVLDGVPTSFCKPTATATSSSVSTPLPG